MYVHVPFLAFRTTALRAREAGGGGFAFSKRRERPQTASSVAGRAKTVATFSGGVDDAVVGVARNVGGDSKVRDELI